VIGSRVLESRIRTASVYQTNMAILASPRSRRQKGLSSATPSRHPDWPQQRRAEEPLARVPEPNPGIDPRGGAFRHITTGEVGGLRFAHPPCACWGVLVVVRQLHLS